jgi:hypothetical protein
MKYKVGLADEAVKKKFLELQDSTYEDRCMFATLNNAIDRLSNDAFCGIQIQKKIIPPAYKKKYQLDNLWKYNLPDGWRLLYFVIEDDENIIAIIIDWVTHKEYERLFGYG